MLREPIPVTDDDVNAAWYAMYERETAWAHVPTVPPDPAKLIDKLTLDGLRRVLENDRKRVADRSVTA